MSNTVKGVAVAAALAIVCTACGNDDDSSEAAASTDGSQENLSGTPIVIGQLVSETGPGVSTFAEAAKATEAWQEQVNSQGGIGGHPVRVEMVDDESSGSAGLAATQSLVEDEDVVALVGAFNPIALASSLPYLEDQEVALINAFPVLPQDFTSPVAFPIGQDTTDDVVSSLEVLKASGEDDVALVACAETPACEALGPVIEAEGPGVDVDYQGTTTVSASATDYTAQCLNLKEEEVGVLWMATAATVTQSLQADCSRQDYEPTYFFGYNAFTPGLLELPGMAALGANYTVPYFSDVEALSAYQDAMESAGHSDAASVVSLDTWAALEMFRTALENHLPAIDGRVPSREDVFQALYTVQDEDLGGILPEGITYTEDDHHPSMTCQFAVGIDSGEYTLPNDDTPICVDG